jgi:hypothetical protein
VVVVGLAGRAYDDCPAGDGELHRDGAHPARRAVDQQGIPLRYLEQAEHAQRRLGRDRQRRRLRPPELGRLGRHGGGQRVLGVPPAVGEAQHVVAGGESLDPRPDPVDRAGDLKAQHRGQLRGEHLLGRAGADRAVDPVHAGRPHPHSYLPRAWFRQLPVGNVEHPGSTKLVDDYRLHVRTSSFRFPTAFISVPPASGHGSAPALGEHPGGRPRRPPAP